VGIELKKKKQQEKLPPTIIFPTIKQTIEYKIVINIYKHEHYGNSTSIAYNY
jgi:hypothetical protein